MSPDHPDGPRPGLRVYRADGTLDDPYHVVDNTISDRARRSTWWTERQLELARSDREIRADIFAMEAELDPNDHSPQAEHLREVAGSEHDHADAEARRLEWAAAMLAADPDLAQRMNPAVVHYTRELLAQNAAAPAARPDADTAPNATQDAAADAAAEAELWAEHDRDLAVAARLEGPGIDDLGIDDGSEDAAGADGAGW